MNPELRPANETARLQAVARYRTLGTLHEKVFDELVSLAANLCRVPISFLSLVEAETVWFRYTSGWQGAEHLARDFSLCSVAILHDEVTVFENLQREPCRLIQSAEIDLLGLQFFVGMPLKTRDGFNIGVLAIADQQPRSPILEDHRLLESYARLLISLLDLYQAAAHSLPVETRLYEVVEDSVRWMQKLATSLWQNGVPSVAETSRVKAAIGAEADDITQQLQQALRQFPNHSSGAA